MAAVSTSMSLPALNAAMPSRSLSRLEMTRSITDINWDGQVLEQVEQRRASSVAQRNYPDAKNHYTTMIDLQDDFNRAQTDRERRRQTDEFSKLHAAFKHLQHDLNTEWDEKMEMFKRQCERMWEHLEQRHKVQHDELNKECEPLRRLKPKFSPELLRMMTCEKTLAKLHRYDECQEMRRRVQIRTGVELADFRGSINERITLRFSRLGKRQGEDRQTMHQTIHGMRTTIKRKRERASKVQHQRLKNNSHDMRHAHKNEFNDIQARVPGLQVQPRKSYQRKSSTFRGTHFCRNMASTHNPGSWGGVLSVIDHQNSQSNVDYMNLTIPVEMEQGPPS